MHAAKPNMKVAATELQVWSKKHLVIRQIKQHWCKNVRIQVWWTSEKEIVSRPHQPSLQPIHLKIQLRIKREKVCKMKLPEPPGNNNDAGKDLGLGLFTSYIKSLLDREKNKEKGSFWDSLVADFCQLLTAMQNISFLLLDCTYLNKFEFNSSWELTQMLEVYMSKYNCTESEMLTLKTNLSFLFCLSIPNPRK